MEALLSLNQFLMYLSFSISPLALLQAGLLQTKFRTAKLQAPGTTQDRPGHWHLISFPYQPPFDTQQPRRHPLPLWRPVQSQAEENPQGIEVWEASDEACDAASVIYFRVYRSGRFGLGAGPLMLLFGDE